jgi:hypothetical protein
LGVKNLLGRDTGIPAVFDIIWEERKETALHNGLSVSERMMTITRPK